MTRTAIVTGGTRGIGLAIRDALKAAGVRVGAHTSRAMRRPKADLKAFLQSLDPRRRARSG